MDSLRPLQANAQSMPAADVTFENKLSFEDSKMNYHAYQVKTPQQDLEDFIIQVRASILNKCRNKLNILVRRKFAWKEFCLAFSTLFGGLGLGALTSNIEPNTWKYIFFYTACPVLFIGLMVACIFLEHNATQNPRDIITEVLTDLPDPKEAR